MFFYVGPLLIAVLYLKLIGLPYGNIGILSYFISSHLISSHLISSHLISSHLISSPLIPSHLILSHLISSHPILSHLISSHPVLSHLISSYLNCEALFIASAKPTLNQKLLALSLGESPNCQYKLNAKLTAAEQTLKITTVPKKFGVFIKLTTHLSKFFHIVLIKNTSKCFCSKSGNHC